MSETKENVVEETQLEENVQPRSEEITPSEIENSAPPEEEKVSDKEINFQKLRETKEQLEKENRELKQWVEQYGQPSKETTSSSEEDLDLADDDLVDGKVVKRLFSELKNLKKTYEQEKAATIPDRLKAKFQDFDQVVTKENIEKLKYSEPEIYSSIISGRDLYAKGVSAYKTLKALGIVKEDPFVESKESVQQNHRRPLSAQAIKGQSALAEANVFAKGLTPELKKQLQQEMSQSVKAR